MMGNTAGTTAAGTARTSSGRRLPVVVRALLATSARAALLTLAGLLLWAALPAAWGWTPTTIQSDSMAPAIRTGDVVVAMPLNDEDLVPGLDVLVRDPDHDERLRFHRFVRWSDNGELVLKGDANADPDSSTVPVADVLGAGVVRVPFIGLPVVWVRTGDVVALGLSALSLLGLCVFAAMDPTTPAPIRLRPAGAGHTAGRTRVRLRRGRKVAAVGTAITAASLVLTVSALLPQHGAWAAYGASSPNASSNLAAASAYDCLTGAPASSPALYYGFAETSGTSAGDTSGNARNGTLRGTVARNAGSCVAGSTPFVTLDGSTGYVSIPTEVNSLQNFTLSMWFKSTTTRGGTLIGFGNTQTGTPASSDRHIYMTNAGRLVFGAAPNNTATTITSTASYNDGAWHHVAATLGSTGMRLYVDGAQAAANTSVTTGRTQVGYFRVGNGNLSGWANAPTSSFFAGSVDGVGIYTSVLPASTISAQYAAKR